MSTMIEQMLSKYNIENLYDHKNAMKEIMPVSYTHLTLPTN